MMTLDIILVSAKLVSFLLILLSAGGTIFYHLYSSELDKSQIYFAKTLAKVTFIALIYSLIFLFVDAARFAGSFDGIFDYELQKMILLSHLGVAKIMSIMGLIVILFSNKIKEDSRIILAIIGVSLVAFSYTYTGHTSENTYRFILAPLLFIHLIVILFWFGALFPLYYIIKVESHEIAGRIVNDFSKKATILVPMIFAAGIIMSVILMEGMNFLSHEYGLILLLKITFFSILMLIAALNKWRLAPDLERGKPSAVRNLQKAIIIEILLITLIIGATVILTGYFSSVPSG